MDFVIHLMKISWKTISAWLLFNSHLQCNIHIMKLSNYVIVLRINNLSLLKTFLWVVIYVSVSLLSDWENVKNSLGITCEFLFNFINTWEDIWELRFIHFKLENICFLKNMHKCLSILLQQWERLNFILSLSCNKARKVWVSLRNTTLDSTL